jgi:nucleotide-binding universal stress UspA family protein
VDVVIGTTPDQGGRDAVTLGLTTARTFGLTPVLAHVYPRPFDFPSQASVDAEWRAYLQEQASTIVHDAGEAVRAAGWEGELAEHVHGNRSSGVGLAEVADDRAADLIVIGSAPGGRPGQLTSGSTADQLFHGSPVPVLMAPQGYQAVAAPRIERLVVAHQLTKEGGAALRSGAERARAAGVPVHLISVITKVNRIAASTVGRDPEAMVVAELTRHAEAAMERASTDFGTGMTHQVVVSDTVTDALEAVAWSPGDVLVIGSSGAGPLRRVFLGDMSFKLLRAARVPTMVIPRDL